MAWCGWLCSRFAAEASSPRAPEKQSPEPYIPCAAPGVGVIAGGKIVYTAGFGVTRRTIFHLASVTKPFVATSILQPMEEGKVDTRPWITHRAGYQDLVEQFPSWLDPDRGVVKAMLEL